MPLAVLQQIILVPTLNERLALPPDVPSGILLALLDRLTRDKFLGCTSCTPSSPPYWSACPKMAPVCHDPCPLERGAIDGCWPCNAGASSGSRKAMQLWLPPVSNNGLLLPYNFFPNFLSLLSIANAGVAVLQTEKHLQQGDA
ncbi:hypothetical protein K449DRAFT_436476 [Hypoxylon sp. EC38]|nr:hypothetical protein K449DRAFT_436476 [Hypoxylon sp. EC38]